MGETINWQQAVKILECSQSHFYNLVNSGALPSVRSGKIRGVRVKREDCEKYVKQWRERLDGGGDIAEDEKVSCK